LWPACQTNSTVVLVPPLARRWRTRLGQCRSNDALYESAKTEAGPPIAIGVDRRTIEPIEIATSAAKSIPISRVQSHALRMSLRLRTEISQCAVPACGCVSARAFSMRFPITASMSSNLGHGEERLRFEERVCRDDAAPPCARIRKRKCHVPCRSLPPRTRAQRFGVDVA